MPRRYSWEVGNKHYKVQHDGKTALDNFNIENSEQANGPVAREATQNSCQGDQRSNIVGGKNSRKSRLTTPKMDVVLPPIIQGKRKSKSLSRLQIRD